MTDGILVERWRRIEAVSISFVSHGRGVGLVFIISYPCIGLVVVVTYHKNSH